MSPALKERYFIPYWSEDRMRRHLAMLQAFGFNAIQVTACGQVARNSGVTQAAWNDKLVVVCRLAKEMGLDIAQFVWGTCFYVSGEPYITNLDWHVPAERSRMERFFEEESFLAPWVDRVSTHWIDPGGPQKGCARCNIDAAVEIHNAIVATFARKNPKIQGSFSNWFMGDEKGWAVQWPGYAGTGALAAHPALGRHSGIALGRQNYIMDGTREPGPKDTAYVAHVAASELEAIRRAGRRAGVWCWYTTDLEILPSLHVHTDLLQKFFAALPPQAPDLLDWMSVEDNCHGLNMHNLYVAARLMQDPRLDAHGLLNDFVRGFFGERNTEPVVQALRAIELVRCRSLRYAPEKGDSALAPGHEHHNRWLYPEWIERNLASVHHAIAGLSGVTADPAFEPIWPVTMPPADYLDELKAHLAAVRNLLTFCLQALKVDAMKKSGVSKERLESAIQALPTLAQDPAHSTGLEFAVCQRILRQLRAVDAEDDGMTAAP